MKKMMIFAIIGAMMISLTGCSSNEKINKAKENGIIKTINVEEIQVEEIQVENIEVEDIIEETRYIDSEYLSELSYNSKENSWN